ncbi:MULTISPECIES: dTDP-4-dehydrorhamnose reductase [unclassified Acidiphilium]|uniref:dTDP-4-dehydrorhamnose reductase n=1 Tax=unclassified Acidiphilium TaxID=2617493 RepID=UPI000BDACF5C|nr:MULTISPECIES: dTDP-4-dehydrorhamnose reductase [unclassified Acidiphilium]OYV55913.1 MAG: dTDP-4-dehydrorhamnose reductase [Acidiphilium sp. 20-67-58]OYV85848.1 MAG: dTDP-4-dehydrorhamnose reductase [Acidiphilium sp. 21-68-69]HQT61159.1 dTDP-4-dehydrorhamnose reductase [Acidiphilium sp.]
MDTRPILITGVSGQLGHALSLHAARTNTRFHAVGRPGFDFDAPETIAAALADADPALVVNAAAWTAIDAAEASADAAFRANRDGPATLATLCRARGIPLIHVSTDYVFDGTKGAPYTETDPIAPLGVYGESKAAGEAAILASGAEAIILRTAWVFSATGKNFARTMIAAASRLSALRVVADQRGAPTAAEDLAEAILAIAARIVAAGWQPGFAGIFHATSAGDTTWHGFATEILAIAARHGTPHPDIIPIATADWPTPTRRPADSRLDTTKLQQTFGLALPHWKDATARIVPALLAQERAS